MFSYYLSILFFFLSVDSPIENVATPSSDIAQNMVSSKQPGTHETQKKLHITKQNLKKVVLYF